MTKTTLETELQPKLTPSSSTERPSLSTTPDYAGRSARASHLGAATSVVAASPAESANMKSAANRTTFVVCLYAAFTFGGLWASLNFLHWFWRQIL
jgi:hypothetical protein